MSKIVIEKREQHSKLHRVIIENVDFSMVLYSDRIVKQELVTRFFHKDVLVAMFPNKDKNIEDFRTNKEIEEQNITTVKQYEILIKKTINNKFIVEIKKVIGKKVLAKTNFNVDRVIDTAQGVSFFKYDSLYAFYKKSEILKITGERV